MVRQGKTRKHGHSTAAKSKSRGHGKGKRTMKGGWFDPKKLAELSAEKLLKNYGRPKNFFGRYGDFSQKQADKDNDVLKTLSNEKKAQLCREIGNISEEYTYKEEINTQLNCNSTYAAPKSQEKRLKLQMPTEPAQLPYTISEENNIIGQCLETLYSYKKNYKNNNFGKYTIAVISKKTNPNDEIISIIETVPEGWHEVLRYSLVKCRLSESTNIYNKIKDTNNFYIYKRANTQKYIICPSPFQNDNGQCSFNYISDKLGSGTLNLENGYIAKFAHLNKFYDNKKPTFYPICDNVEINESFYHNNLNQEYAALSRHNPQTAMHRSLSPGNAHQPAVPNNLNIGNYQEPVNSQYSRLVGLNISHKTKSSGTEYNRATHHNRPRGPPKNPYESVQRQDSPPNPNKSQIYESVS